jgi:hypothetical protein
MRSDSLKGDLNMRRRSVIPRLVGDGPLDVDDLECIESQAAVMSFRIGDSGDRVEYCLIDVCSRADGHDYVLMLVMFRHGSSSSDGAQWRKLRRYLVAENGKEALDLAQLARHAMVDVQKIVARLICVN